MIIIYKPETKVHLIGAKLDGVITCTSLRGGGVQYEISYFLNGEQKVIWVSEFEFTTDEIKTAIGYK